MDGKWATEIEILALSHLLKTKIHTYSQNRWVTFSGRMVNSENMALFGDIYLDHKNQNHYDFVTSITSGENISMTPSQKLLCLKENRWKITDRNQKKQQRKSISFRVSAKEKKLCRKNMKYKTDP